MGDATNMTQKDTSVLEPSVIGNLLTGDRSRIEEVAFNVGLRTTDLYDAKCRIAYDVIMELYRDGLVATPAIVASKSKRRLRLDWLEEIASKDQLLTQELADRARVIIDQADERQTRLALVGGLTALDSGRVVKDVRLAVVETLQQTRGVVVAPARASDIHGRIDQSQTKIFVTPTGYGWLDGWLRGGLRSNRFYAVAGPQGGRKTTWARNIAIAALRDKHNRPRPNVEVAILGYENDREITYFDFVSMMAAEFLKDTGQLTAKLPDNAGNQIPIMEWLDAESIQLRYMTNRLAGVHPLIKKAVEAGMSKVDELHLSIYDSGEETGDLTDKSAMTRVIRSHHYNHVTPDTHYIAIVDYAQLARQTDSLFEDMEQLARESLKLSQNLNMTLIVLSQYNEDTNKDHAQGNKEYVRLKGGGDIRAGVQNLMLVDYNANHPDKLTIKSGKARRGKGAAAHTFDIEPVSGMIFR